MFSIGIYDLFAYTIPGLLYLFVFNEISKHLQLTYFDLSTSIDNIAYIILLGVLAFLVGNVMDFFGYYFCYRILSRKRNSKITIDRLKKNYPTLGIRFKDQEWHILVNKVRLENLEVSLILDRYQAYSIMLRNFSFGLFLFSILHFVLFFSSGFSAQSIIIASLAMVFSIIANQRSQKNDKWFYEGVFGISLNYGTDVVDIIKTAIESKKISKIRTRKTILMTMMINAELFCGGLTK